MIARRLPRLLPVALALATLALRPVAAGAGDDLLRLPTLVSEGVPRGLVTMIVPIPAELADAAEVTYEVRLTSGVEILGRLRGPARVAGAPSRPLVLTLRVPAGADAGTLDVAEVIFRDGTGREYLVPLQLRVSVVRSITIQGTRELRSLRSGDRLELPYRIVNAGNSTDTVRIVVRGPLGWGVRLDREALAVLPPRGQLAFSVSVGVPATANLGDHTLTVALQPARRGEELSSAFTTLGITGRAGEVAGLVLRPTLAVAATSSGSATFSGVELAGPVAQGVSLRAYLTPAVARDGMASQGLNAVGAQSAPFSASLYGATWDVSAGNTALQLTDLSGVNLIGRGVTGRVERRDLELRAIVARPANGTGDVQGELLGIGFWRPLGGARVGGSLSYLTEQGGLARGRQLRAAAVDYRSQPYGSVTLGASIGHRSYADASGVGYALTVMHERPKERASFRLAHAPGGSAAFARAEDEWQFEVSRAFTDRWSADAAAQRSVDRGNVFAGMTAGTWSLGQRFLARPDLGLTLRAQESRFTVSSTSADAGDFGARDRQGIAGAEWRRGLLGVSTEFSFGQVARITELFDGRVDESVAAQRGARVTVSRAFERLGSIDANGSLEQTAAGVGVPAAIRAFGIRWNDIPLTFGTRPAYFSAETAAQRLGDMATMVVTRASLRAALPGGLDLAITAERNPFFRDARGNPGWIGAIRLSAATRVHSAAMLGPEGRVFEDRDGNGRLDPGEPGIAGVVVRRGDAKATSDREGRYRLPVNARGRARLDQGSLRAGLVPHPALAQDTVERLDLPVLPTGSVVIDLVLTADESGRRPEADLEPAVVLLRDASGFEWVGRRIGPTAAAFDGLPIGRFELVVNFARVREPLRVDDLTVQVEAHRSTTVAVPVRGRAVRVFTPPSRQQGKSQR